MLPPGSLKWTLWAVHTNLVAARLVFIGDCPNSQPSPTVVTSPIQKATMMCHPTKDRPLSVAEYARIQQFPDNWTLTGTTIDKYRQIGNAVPVGLAKAIGDAIVSVAEGTSTIQVKRVRGTSHSRKNTGRYSNRRYM